MASTAKAVAWDIDCPRTDVCMTTEGRRPAFTFATTSHHIQTSVGIVTAGLKVSAEGAKINVETGPGWQELCPACRMTVAMAALGKIAADEGFNRLLEVSIDGRVRNVVDWPISTYDLWRALPMLKARMEHLRRRIDGRRVDGAVEELIADLRSLIELARTRGDHK